MIAGIFLCFFAPVLAQNRRAQTHYTQVQHTQVQTRHAHSGGHDGTGKEKRGGFGGVVLIGPIPLVFGSDKKMALLAAIVAILVILSLLLFFIPMLRAA
ncbi:MAG: DUF131 domain-containing protein [Thermoplasmata archaeon]|nr:DUF131 domain-containing protein [Thermoplasmata archaeon]